MKCISPDEARDFLERWSVAAEAERQELRATPVALKLKQLAALMASASLFVDGERSQSEEEVRSRWMRIRRAYGHR